MSSVSRVVQEGSSSGLEDMSLKSIASWLEEDGSGKENTIDAMVHDNSLICYETWLMDEDSTSHHENTLNMSPVSFTSWLQELEGSNDSLDCEKTLELRADDTSDKSFSFQPLQESSGSGLNSTSAMSPASLLPQDGSRNGSNHEKPSSLRDGSSSSLHHKRAHDGTMSDMQDVTLKRKYRFRGSNKDRMERKRRLEVIVSELEAEQMEASKMLNVPSKPMRRQAGEGSSDQMHPHNPEKLKKLLCNKLSSKKTRLKHELTLMNLEEEVHSLKLEMQRTKADVAKYKNQQTKLEMEKRELHIKLANFSQILAHKLDEREALKKEQDALLKLQQMQNNMVDSSRTLHMQNYGAHGMPPVPISGGLSIENNMVNNNRTQNMQNYRAHNMPRAPISGGVSMQNMQINTTTNIQNNRAPNLQSMQINANLNNRHSLVSNQSSNLQINSNMNNQAQNFQTMQINGATNAQNLHNNGVWRAQNNNGFSNMQFMQNNNGGLNMRDSLSARNMQFNMQNNIGVLNIQNNNGTQNVQFGGVPNVQTVNKSQFGMHLK